MWDTAGQECFNTLHPSYYFGAHAAILVTFVIIKKNKYSGIWCDKKSYIFEPKDVVQWNERKLSKYSLYFSCKQDWWWKIQYLVKSNSL